MPQIFSIATTPAIVLLVCAGFGTAFYYLRKAMLLQNNLLAHIQRQHPNDWQRFISQGKHCGDEHKWARHFALEALREGKFTDRADKVLNLGTADIKRLQQWALLGFIFGMTVCQIFGAIG
ncbi:hypothetical protein VXM60_18655 [Shewanella khirikhana]|uniref:hypothetical protein n=1 Tax=Shewanella khirikhana TaxID=1965282 RepID=UPI0030CCC61E